MHVVVEDLGSAGLDLARWLLGARDEHGRVWCSNHEAYLAFPFEFVVARVTAYQTSEHESRGTRETLHDVSLEPWLKLIPLLPLANETTPARSLLFVTIDDIYLW